MDTCRNFDNKVFLENYENGHIFIDILHNNAINENKCNNLICNGSIVQPENSVMTLSETNGLKSPGDRSISSSQMISEARDFLNEFAAFHNMQNTEDHLKRVDNVISSIMKIGTYEQTFKELKFACKLAWRNSSRCIGRINWKKLKVFDSRNIKCETSMFERILNHIKYATNNGKLRATITIFPPSHHKNNKNEFRIWNSQLIRFAGHRIDDNQVIGDPLNINLTMLCRKLGYEFKVKTPFDILPIIIQQNGEYPKLFEIPEEYILMVDIKHPIYEWFGDMNLKWYALPAVSNMCLNAGGIKYTAAPFNGWYASFEIAARNLSDKQRYNLLPIIATKMGLDLSNNFSLWQDKAHIELSIAVIHSFRIAGVTMIDHHSASNTFMSHFEKEHEIRGGCPSDWVWIVPPISNGITSVFHQEMLNYKLLPNFEYMVDCWECSYNSKIIQDLKIDILHSIEKKQICPLEPSVKKININYKIAILYGSETGRSEAYGKKLCKIMQKNNVISNVCSMNEYSIEKLLNSSQIFFIVSTCGSGECPSNAKLLFKQLLHISNEGLIKLTSLKFCILALGSRMYQTFCQFGHDLAEVMIRLNAIQILQVTEADELANQDEVFISWTNQILNNLIEKSNISPSSYEALLEPKIYNNHVEWSYEKNKPSLPLLNGLSIFYQQTVIDLEIIDKTELIHNKPIENNHLEENRSVLLVKLKPSNLVHDEKISYEPGDHLALIPINCEEHVKMIMKNMCDIPDEQSMFLSDSIFDENNELHGRLPKYMNVHEALSFYLDIQKIPSRHFLSLIKSYATNKDHAHTLAILSLDNDCYEEWKFKYNMRIIDILRNYGPFEIPSIILLSNLQRLQPRYYSISSSNLMDNNEIHLTVSVVDYIINDLEGNLTHRKGLCSEYISKSNPGQIIRGFIRNSVNMHLPEDKTSSIIMIGCGTGIAPFRSFWRNKIIDNDYGRKGEWWLIFGCRKPDTDELYSKEIQTCIDNKVFDKYIPAYSRSSSHKKTYVQDVINEYAMEIIEMIVDKNAHIYVCGDANMASQLKALFRTLLTQYAAMTPRNSQNFLDVLKNEGRYHEDIFGIVLNNKQIMERLRKATLRAWSNLKVVFSLKNKKFI